MAGRRRLRERRQRAGHDERLRRGDDLYDCHGAGEFDRESGNLRFECAAAGKAAGRGAGREKRITF